MGCCPCGIAVAGVVILLIYLLKKIYDFFTNIPELPKLDEDRWWGPNHDKDNKDTSVKPFKINVSDKDLDDLKARLANARPFTPPLEGVHHEYGFNTNLLTEIKEFWQTKYNWREREAFLNQYPQYTTNIQGLNIHFLHVKPTESDGLKVVPLLLLHGWPGNVREFYECIPKLTKPSSGRNFVFEVVIPHLPGYGFSEGTSHPGLNSTVMAILLKKLMERLNFDKWYVQGGDWGSDIGTQMATIYPQKILGLHINMVLVQTPMSMLKLILGSFFPSLIVSKENRSKVYPLKKIFMKMMRESGYMHIQSTRPDTVGVGLNDSPLGLAAYILEKFIVWTNDNYKSQQDGGLTLKFNYEKLLDSISIYWFSKCITTSVRLYAESMDLTSPGRAVHQVPVEVPSACAQYQHELLFAPEILVKEKFKNLLQYTVMPTGGHFAAFEEPELFCNDLWNAVEKFENYHKK